MDAVVAVLLAFGSIGLVATVLTVYSTRRLASLRDVDGPSPAVIAALLARRPAAKPERPDAAPMTWQSSSDATLCPTPSVCSWRRKRPQRTCRSIGSSTLLAAPFRS